MDKTLITLSALMSVLILAIIGLGYAAHQGNVDAAVTNAQREGFLLGYRSGVTDALRGTGADPELLKLAQEMLDAKIRQLAPGNR